MKSFSALLESQPEFRQLLAAAKGSARPTWLATGLSHIHKAHYIYSLCAQSGKTALVVMPGESAALKLCEDLNALFGAGGALFYPSRELTFREVEGASHEYEHARLEVLGRLAAGECKIAVAAAEGAVQLTIPPEVLRARTRVLRPGESYAESALPELLLSAGYTRAEQVEGVTQFAVRGGILDFFPPESPHPFRVELWGDEIDTIAAFDPATQRRLDQVEQALITPAREALSPGADKFAALLRAQKKNLRGKYGKLASEQLDADIHRLEQGLSLPHADRYLPLLYECPATLFDHCAGSLLFLCEPVSVKETLGNARWQKDEDVKLLLSQGVLSAGCDTFSVDFVEIARALDRETSFVLDTFKRSVPEIAAQGLVEINAVQLSVWSGDYTFLKEELDTYLDRGCCVVIFAGTQRACAALEGDLRRDGVPASAVEDLAKITPGRVWLLEGTLSAGMEYPRLNLVLVTHIKTVQVRAKKRARGKDEKRIKALSDLTVGDFVVHSGHGIGVFEGIVKRDMHGVTKDYIKIRYAGTDMLFVPVTQLDLVSRYIGAAEGKGVRLNKLNSVEWQKTRQRVKGAVKDMAKELTALYAARMNAPGHAFSPDNDWQREFEERFPYEETDDQLRCAEEIKADMQRTAPMDRLLCGDVGFGKTEVALRAVFKCALDSKQCVVLVPTTILAWQHYQTFTQRLEGYPVAVELLSRFKSPAEQKEIVGRLARGQVDVVIGTHRVVQKDIRFKDLGLCIVDEEQRFGVAHKERFKEMRRNIDVLTLSATPIPRTLNMAMSGIRDMSIIEEAPQDRHPVQTYVLEHDVGVLEQAIRKELRRGGQVFYLHNRVESIDSCAARLMELCPEARVVTAHGKMSEDKLSRVWQQLVEHEIDILVCTTIIETGVDVPNCNTLIIEDADRMGLAQLYQLRGRVGRSSRRAFAYLTFKRGKALTDVAAKRLSAIREFTTFGSGFRIAMRDLEIRGAGSILGAQQHGHMEAVGYDLYLRLLAEAVSEEQGTPVEQLSECMIDLRIPAHIPEEYIENLSQRIDIYKKIAAVANQEDALDITDELIDRFGDPPAAVRGLIDVALVRGRAARLGIREISQKEDRVVIYPETLNVEQAAGAAAAMRGRVLLSAGKKPYLTVKVPKGTDPIDTIREALSHMEG